MMVPRSPRRDRKRCERVTMTAASTQPSNIETGHRLPSMYHAKTRRKENPMAEMHDMPADQLAAMRDARGEAHQVDSMEEVQGTYTDRFSEVRDAFAANLDSGADIGASVAVFIDGEPVVDLW